MSNNSPGDEPDPDRLEDLEARNARLARSEREARAELARLQAILDVLPFALYLKDRDGRFLMANAASRDLYGMDPEQLVGTLQRDTHMDAEQWERIRQADLRVMDGGESRSNPAYPFWRSDGALR